MKKSIDFNIRIAEDSDFDQIFDIWQSGLSASFIDSKVCIHKEDFQKYFDKRNDCFNYWIAENEEKKILGWISLNPISEHPLKRNHFAEISIYFKFSFNNGSVPIYLQEYVCKYLSENSEIKYLIAYVSQDNKNIIGYAKKTGWTFLGDFPENKNIDKDLKKTIIIKPIQ